MLPDYDRQAQSYDETRAANAAVVQTMRDALGASPGRRLADIGGGTGNYSLALREHGWEPLVIDLSEAMLARARSKDLPVLLADAEDLPLADGSFDAAAMISVLHHLDRPSRAVEEAKRILAPGGALVVKAYTREDVQDAWPLEYWPSSREWMLATHPPVSELERMLPGMRRLCLVFDDVSDASLAALTARPRLVLDPAWRRQISFFERLERDDPDGLRNGLRRLERDLAAGEWPGEAGRTTVVAWDKPG